MTLHNCLFIYDQVYSNLRNVFSNYFKLFKVHHRLNTRCNNQFTLNVPRVNTETYWSNSVKIEAIKDWNKTAKKLQFHSDQRFKRSEYVKLVKTSFYTFGNKSNVNQLCYTLIEE